MAYYHQRKVDKFRVGLIGGKRFRYASDSVYTYSWRTKQPPGAFVPNAPAFQDGKPLLESLRQRKQFYEEMFSSLNNERYSQDRAYLFDHGHTFLTVRHTTGAFGQKYSYDSGVTWTKFGVPAGIPLYPSWFPIPKSDLTWFSTTEGFGQMFAAFPQSRINGLVGSLVPKNVGIGETIVELVRGDIPSVISSVRRAARNVSINNRRFELLKRNESPEVFDAMTKIILATGNRKPKWLGQVGADYLEVQFGMLPLITSIIDAITALLRVSESLYGDSFRRKRFDKPDVRHFRLYRGDGPSYQASANWTAGLVTQTGEAIAGGTPASANELSIQTTLSTKISLRATLAGRPTSGLMKFYDEAPDIIKSLGLWYPSLGWDILPYSWLVDWALHIGRAIDTAAFLGKDGLYPYDYAYATFKSEALVSRSGFRRYRSYNDRVQFEPGIGSGSTSRGTYRVRINPFGFPTDLGQLSGTQYGILIALGLAKSR